MPELSPVRLLQLACLVGVVWLRPASGMAATLNLSARRLVPSHNPGQQWDQVTNAVSWECSATAVVICDMWNHHWCKGASARVATLARSEPAPGSE